MSYQSEVLADGPVRYYRLEEAAGNLAADSSGNGGDATHQGGVTPGVAGPVDLAAAYSGASNSWTSCGPMDIGLRAPSTLGDGFTLECWYVGTDNGTNASTATVGPQRPFLSASTASNNKQWVWGMQANGVPGIWFAASYLRAVATTPVNDGNPHHIAVSVERAGGGWTVRFYLDGVLDASRGAISSSTDNHTPTMMVARNGRATGSVLAGVIDEIACYPTVLADARIAAHYAAATPSGPVSTPAPVDLPLAPGPASLVQPMVFYRPAPVDLPLSLGAASALLPSLYRPAPVDLPLSLGAASWTQNLYTPAPIDLPLGLGDRSVLVQPIILVAPPVVIHVAGAIAVPPRPPSIAPGQTVEVTVELRRGATGALLGRFRTGEVERATWPLNGVGEAEFSWVPRVDQEPEVVPHLIDGGEPLSWWDDDLEVWIYRAGQLVWCGPVVHHAHDPRSGRLRTRCWSREGYVKRLTYGRSTRTNLLPQGHFDAGLSGWAAASGTSMAAVSSPTYRLPWTMRLTGSGRPKAATSITLAAQPRLNIVNFLLVGQYLSGSGWPEDPSTRSPAMGRIIRTLTRPGSGEILQRDSYPALVEDSTGYGPGQWLRSNRAVRREAGVTNHYRLEVYGALDTTTWIGEAEAVYSENIGAYAGGGRRFSSWVAALAKATTEYLAGGDWTYDVGPAGPVLVSPMRTDAHDHPLFWSLYEDATVYGDWWCPVQPERVIRYRARRGSYRPELRIVGRDAANQVTAEWDSADDGVANEMLALSDGQEGPTREAGGALDNAPGARLQRAEMAPPGILPRDLDLYAERILSTEGRPRRRASLAPAVGPPSAADPTRRDVPGAIIHVAQPGDWTDFRQLDGALDYTFDLVVETMEWSPRTDSVAITWRAS